MDYEATVLVNGKIVGHHVGGKLETTVGFFKKRMRHKFYCCVFLLRMDQYVLVSVVKSGPRIFKINYI